MSVDNASREIERSMSRLSRAAGSAASGFARGGELGSRLEDYGELFISQALRIGKSAVESSVLQLVRRWREGYDQLFDNWSFYPDIDTDAVSTLLHRKEAGRQAVLAWMLFQWRASGAKLAGDEWANMFREIYQPLNPLELWLALLQASDHEVAQRLGWEWWEVFSRPAGAGVQPLTFNERLQEACLISIVMSASHGGYASIRNLPAAEIPAGLIASCSLRSRGFPTGIPN